MATTRNKNSVTTGEILTPKSLLAILRERNIAETLTEFSKQIGRNRTTIYFALEKPQRFPLAYQRIIKAIR